MPLWPLSATGEGPGIGAAHLVPDKPQRQSTHDEATSQQHQ